jgi:integrase/recombinase XerD
VPDLRQLAIVRKRSVLARYPVPAIIRDAGPDTIRRFVEFFTANIRNKNTRMAYLRAVRRFCSWADNRQISISRIEPIRVAEYIEGLSKSHSDLTVKQHLAAIRMLFDYLVTGGVLRTNPSASVKGPKVVITKGKTPVLSAADTRRLLDSIDATTIVGLRDRALISVMVFTFARVGAAVRLDVRDVYTSSGRYWIRLREKGGRYHEMPLSHNAEAYLSEYLDAAGLRDQPDTPLFRTIGKRQYITRNRMHRNDVLRMIKRRARRAGLLPDICCHTFRATGITEYMRNGGTLERAQHMAAHASSRTTNLYNRIRDEVTLDEVERVLI